MTMHAEDRPFADRPSHLTYNLGVFAGHGIAYGIGDIERGCAGLYRCAKCVAEITTISPRRILTGKFHIFHVAACMTHGAADLIQSLGAAQAEFVFEVDVGGGEEDMNTRFGS